jgi:hypothetical protein
MAGSNLRLSENFSIRPGMMFQLWAQGSQDPIPQANGDPGGYTKNIYLRRARFYVLGGIGKNINFFVLWEMSNLGLATANADLSVNKNFLQFNFNDAYFDYKVNPNISFQAGLMIIPFARNILQSTATYWGIDVGGVSATYIAATQTSTLRDTGVQLKVNAVDSHFEARAMVSQGVKLPDTAGRGPGKNDPRLTGYVQYNFLDPDAGYVFNGQYFGRKKIAGVAAGIDYQSLRGENPYFATSASLFAAIPLAGPDPKNGGDEIGGIVQFLHFHGGGAAPASTLGKQNDVLAELGYYNKNAKFSVFGKYEGRFFDAPAPGNANDIRIYGGGVKYFFAEQMANLTLQYSQTQFPHAVAAMPPATGSSRNAANLIQAMFQLQYF